MKRHFALLTALICILFTAATALFPAAEAADTGASKTPSMPQMLLQLNLSELKTPTINKYYRVDGNVITLKSRDITYMLYGTTTKKITFENNPKSSVSKTFSIIMYGAKCGDISQGANKTWKVNIMLYGGTVSTAGSVKLKNVHLFGGGTLNAADFSTETTAGSSLTVTDAKLNIELARNCVTWDGTALLNGKADVTVIGTDNYTALMLGMAEKTSLTLSDTASLTLTHKNPDKVTAYAINTLYGQKGSTVKLTDKSRLNVTGKPLSDKKHGRAVYLYTEGSGGTFIIKDNAVCDITACGDYALLAGDINIHGGSLTVKNSEAAGIYGVNTVSVKNAAVSVTNAPEKKSIFGKEKLAFEKSWIYTTTAPETDEENITDSVIYVTASGSVRGCVYGNAELLCDTEFPADSYTFIPCNATLTVPEGMTLTNYGEVDIGGEECIINNGTINDLNHTVVWENDETHYWGHCRLCGYNAEKTDRRYNQTTILF